MTNEVFISFLVIPVTYNSFREKFLTYIPVEFERIFDKYNWRMIDVWRPVAEPDRLWIFVLTETTIYKYILRKVKDKIITHSTVIGSIFRWVFDEGIYIATFSETNNVSWSKKSTRGFILQRFILAPDIATENIPISDARKTKNLFYGGHILIKEQKLLENVLVTFDCDSKQWLFVKGVSIFRRPGFPHTGRDIRKYINDLLVWHIQVPHCE